ncbi:MFS transporter [Allonocardiopsis opalescens]|uniref:Putative MFS family arabinose efflux permease n=1 Tax=Allonocardiopsis opalescens TaxID=1144618 RepID=A0A2T0PXS8_9ACTN|nr:MFS transporter [Allonocardiopsis opalescens]PRX96337.1 putative MFS family arabinose efflux permease [Allonocardiopsis opalescens]
MTEAPPRTERPARERRALLSATLTAGAAEVVDFMLPLFAGVGLGASATEIGVLLAVELVLSVLVRPLAGVLADRHERSTVAAVGAALYALACAGYALAPGFGAALGAAALSGVGGALLWVALRALAGERLGEDSGVFARLAAAESTGGWVVFVPALFVQSAVGYQGMFLGLAVCCAWAAAALLSAPRRAAGPEEAEPPGDAADPRAAAALGFGPLGRRLGPMLAAVAATMAAEAAIGLLLLLHLQRGFGLEPMQVAYVFLPGAIAMSVLPEYLHVLVRRFGRRTMLAASSVASALFAAGLAIAPNPVVIAVLWVLSGVAWAVVIPVQQAVIAEAAGPRRLGRGLGLYESACLVGALFGSLGAGALYDFGSWAWAAVVCAAVILAGAVIVPRAVRALGVPDIPSEPPPVEEPADGPEEAEPAARPAGGTGTDAATAPEPVGARPPQQAGTADPPLGGAAPPQRAGSADTPPGGGPPADTQASPTDSEQAPTATPTRLLLVLGAHTAVFAAAIALALLLVPGMTANALFGVNTGGLDVLLRDLLTGQGNLSDLVALLTRVWMVAYAIDLVSTLWKAGAALARRRREHGRR